MPFRRLSSSPKSIGGMRCQFTFFNPGSKSADGGNSPPSPAFTTMGSIRAVNGAELDKAQQIAQESGHIIRIPYQTPINENMTVGFENRTFQIKYIEDEDELHFFLEVYCSEIGQNAGSQK